VQVQAATASSIMYNNIYNIDMHEPAAIVLPSSGSSTSTCTVLRLPWRPLYLWHCAVNVVAAFGVTGHGQVVDHSIIAAPKQVTQLLLSNTMYCSIIIMRTVVLLVAVAWVVLPRVAVATSHLIQQHASTASQHPTLSTRQHRDHTYMPTTTRN
jgi:hypothetical protein